MKRRRRRSRQRRKIPKRAKIWGGDQPEPGSTSATGGCELAGVKATKLFLLFSVSHLCAVTKA